MSVYKEGFHIVSELQKSSVQIWPDSCDSGSLLNKNDSTWNKLKQLVEWYGLKSTRKQTQILESGKTKSLRSVGQEVHLMDEWRTGNTAVYQVTFHELPSTYVRGGNNYHGFVSVDQLKTIPASKGA